jgi:hypothetical protein
LIHLFLLLYIYTKIDLYKDIQIALEDLLTARTRMGLLKGD